MERIKIEQHGGIGLVWFGGWLFTVGYLGLGLGKGIIAIILWPYYIGAALGQ